MGPVGTLNDGLNPQPSFDTDAAHPAQDDAVEEGGPGAPALPRLAQTKTAGLRPPFPVSVLGRADYSAGWITGRVLVTAAASRMVRARIGFSTKSETTAAIAFTAAAA